MTLSVWRYAHLMLAVFSSVFIALIAITGSILAIDAINEKIPSYKVENFNEVTLGESIPALKKIYPEITEITVDYNGFVTLQAMDADYNDVTAYINPVNGKILGKPEKKTPFIQWVTSFHRSLFLHETGRIIVGVTAFLLFLIALSGTILIIKRQQSLRRFFGKISKDSFSQYYHVQLGRLFLIPILLIALTGTYLSLERFHFFGEQKIVHNTKVAEKGTTVQQDLSKTGLFKSIALADVQKIEFPFTDDADEYYTLKLTDREIIVNQFTGEKVSEVIFKKSTVYAQLSLLLHTGRIGVLWAIILCISSASLLFFIYSGFSITLKRKSTRIKNKYKASESSIVLLVGTENGSTLRFANAIHQQLLALGHKSYLNELSDYKNYPNADHLIIFTATHGLGDAPSNGKKFLELLKNNPQNKEINVSVVGFGSTAYPDFCAFAYKVGNALQQQSWVSGLQLHTVNNKSAAEFTQWVKAWVNLTGIPLNTTPALYNQKPKKLAEFKLVNKSADTEHTFVLTIKPRRFTRFTSGDLLAIYPQNNGVERLYSIGKIKGVIQLVVKLHEQGIGSNYLNNLEVGDTFSARIVENKAFHLPKDKSVIMIANGTGIAPFLGMFTHGSPSKEYQLYCGFRKETTITKQFAGFAANEIEKHHLKGFHLAFSREANKIYVMDLIKRDAHNIISHLKQGGVLMVCGAVSMQLDVENTINTILLETQEKPLDFYKTQGQLLTDCY